MRANKAVCSSDNDFLADYRQFNGPNDQQLKRPIEIAPDHVHDRKVSTQRS